MQNGKWKMPEKGTLMGTTYLNSFTLKADSWFLRPIGAGSLQSTPVDYLRKRSPYSVFKTALSGKLCIPPSSHSSLSLLCSPPSCSKV